VPGHDLCYLAEHGLLDGGKLPQTLFADMSGALLVSEKALAMLMLQKPQHARISLSSAAEWLAMPKRFSLTGAGNLLGGGFSGYQIYAAKDGPIAVAALEPRFANSLAALAGLTSIHEANAARKLSRFFKARSLAELGALAEAHDLPLHPAAGPAHAKLPTLP
jgi:alpha-methylacyl-CoA racemase